MKHLIFKAAAAVLSAAVCAAAFPVSANDVQIQKITIEAEKNAVTTDTLKNGDFVMHGGMYFRDYTDISSLRTILMSDSPLTIENGGFAWVEGKEEQQLRLIEQYTTAMYTQYSEFTGLSNIALFYTANSELGEIAKLRDPESPLIEFDIRVPQNTPAGDYSCYISQKVQINAVGQTEYDFICISRKQSLNVGTDVELVPLVFSVYTRGDVNCSGEVEALDAQRALAYYLENSIMNGEFSREELENMLGTKHTQAALYAMDINGNGTVEASDAQAILKYYLDGILENPQTWE